MPKRQGILGSKTIIGQSMVAKASRLILGFGIGWALAYPVAWLLLTLLEFVVKLFWLYVGSL